MASAPPKRSIFSKPSWATGSAPAPQNAPEEIFGKSQVYEDIVAENRKKKERRTTKANDGEELEVRHTKRRRLSEKHEEDNDSDRPSEGTKAGLQESIREGKQDSKSTPTKQKAVSALASPIKLSAAPQQQPDATRPIVLDDDEEVQITSVVSAKNPIQESESKHPSEEDSDDPPDSEDDDDYTRDLKRRAREKRQAEKVAFTSVSPSTPIDTDPRGPIQQSASPSETKDDAPLIQIYITSIYPNTKPLIVKEVASKPLKRVKEIWCIKFGLRDRVDEFFLTWNLAKLFDSSNLLSALEALKRKRPDDGDPSNGKIHLEMMDARIFEHRQQQKAREEAEAIAPTEERASQEREPASPLPEPKYMIHLRARDLKEIHLRVRPSQQVSKIMDWYRTQMNIQDDSVFWLDFDGEKLEPTSTIETAGLEDDDVVEVVFP